LLPTISIVAPSGVSRCYENIDSVAAKGWSGVANSHHKKRRQCCDGEEAAVLSEVLSRGGCAARREMEVLERCFQGSLIGGPRRSIFAGARSGVAAGEVVGARRCKRSGRRPLQEVEAEVAVGRLSGRSRRPL
jgi:hypothetical protein